MNLVDRPRSSDQQSELEPATQLVVGRIGTQRFAWPIASVERVLPMAAVTRVADLPSAVAGLLNVHGDTLAVVDPRPRLGLPIQSALPEHHLLLLMAPGRYLLWVDCIEVIVDIDAAALEALHVDAAPFITHIDGELVSVLSARAFDPGRVIQSVPEHR